MLSLEYIGIKKLSSGIYFDKIANGTLSAHVFATAKYYFPNINGPAASARKVFSDYR